MPHTSGPLDLAPSANGRASGKSWKAPYKPTAARRRATEPFEERMVRTQRERAVKKLENSLKEERAAAAAARVETIRARRAAKEDKARIEQSTANMNARKAARLKKRAGRSKKISG